MSALTATVQGRIAAQSIMVDTATITRPGGAPTFDPATGLLVPSAGTVVHEGPCRLRQPTPQESEALFGEAQVAISRFIAVFPYDVEGVQVDDVVTLTETGDPDIAGVEFRVTAVPLATYTLYKGFPCEAVA